VKRRSNWLTFPLPVEEAAELLGLPGNPSAAVHSQNLVLDTVTIPTPCRGLSSKGFRSSGVQDSLRARLVIKGGGRVIDDIQSAEWYRNTKTGSHGARLVVRGHVDPIERKRWAGHEDDLQEPSEVVLSKRDRGSRRGVVDWHKLRNCSLVKCELSYCPECGRGVRRRAVVGRVHAVGVLADDWGADLTLGTLTAPHTMTAQEAWTRKRGASAIYAALFPTGRFVMETKDKQQGGPSCCSDFDCQVCFGQGFMRQQHLHAHAAAVIGRGFHDYAGWNRVVKETAHEHGWTSINIRKKKSGSVKYSASHAAGYMSSYAAKLGEEPWQWAKLRSLLGRRWGESWGAVRGLEKTLAVTLDRGVKARAVHVGYSENPSWDYSAAAFSRRLRVKLREFRRVEGLADFGVLQRD
jgi:hypothetical protein